MMVAIPAAIAGASFAAMKAGAFVEPAQIPVRQITVSGTEVGAASTGAKEILFAKWGEKENELGKSGGSEGALVGAPSFTVDASGDVYILDQVKARASKYSSTGTKLRDIALPSDKIDEIKTAENGDLYALEALTEPTVYRISDGQKSLSIPLSKEKISSARYPSITALFLEGKKAFVEFGHDQVIEIADETGEPIKPAEQEVAPFRRGRAVKGAQDLRISPEQVSRDRVTLLVSGAGERPLYRISILSKQPIDSIIDIQSDRAGNQYVLLHTMRPNSSSQVNDGASGLVLVSFDSSGKYRGQLNMPYLYNTDVFRQVEVSSEGRIYQLQTTRDGARIVAWPKVEL